MLATTAGCSDDFMIEETPERLLLPGEYYFVLTTDEPGSRVAYEDEIRSVFETGDQIGVFATNSEKQIQNDVFSARPINSNTPIQVLAPPKGDVTQELDTEIPLPAGSEPHYYFYFPMNKSWKLSDITKGTGLTYSVETDQTTKEAYQKSDFLWNYLIPDPDASYQTVDMHHLMANIIVKIHKDSIDTSVDATTGKPKGVTLKEMHTSASGIVLKDQKPGEMGYVVNKNTTSDILMYCQGESGDYLLYRAAVPAWTEKKADEPIFTVTLFDRNGNPEEVTYKLAKDLALKDGYYYTFTLRSAAKPAIPDVTKDNSWVLDIFDPDEPGKIVGMLCREYVRYQPGVGLNDVENITGTPIDDKSKYISSQAWVFYNLKNGYESEGIIDLDHGTILRILYDFRVAAQYTVQNKQLKFIKWPSPHINFRGSGAYVLVDHGHTWDDGEYNELNSGKSSSLYQWKGNEYCENGNDDPETGELYMHGGTIEWSKTEGKHPLSADQVLEFYNISNFTMPEKKVTNHIAAINGHIAIDGDKVYVSYEPFEGSKEIDNPSIKVGIPKPHLLHDVRGVEINDYPIVKIGYNNFWMSKSLRTELLSNGESLIYHYSKIGEGNPTYYDDVWAPGYIYSKRDQFDVNTQATDIEKHEFFPKLYNYVAFEKSEFLPDESKIDATGKNRFMVMHPTSTNFGTMLNYFGTTFAGKLCSDEFVPQNSSGAYTVDDSQIESALRHCQYTSETNNVYVANISGFNLLPMGSFGSNSFGTNFGEQFNLWLKIPDEDKYVDSKLVQHTITFNTWTPFAPNVLLSQVFEAKTSTVNENNENMMLTHRFLPARFLMRMKHQQNTGGSTNVVKSAIRSVSKTPYNTTDKPSRVVPVSIIKSNTSK